MPRGLLDARRGDDHLVAVDLHAGRMPDAVFTGQEEELHLVVAVRDDLRVGKSGGANLSWRSCRWHCAGFGNHQATLGMVELDDHLVALDLVGLEHRAVGDDPSCHTGSSARAGPGADREPPWPGSGWHPGYRSGWPCRYGECRGPARCPDASRRCRRCSAVDSLQGARFREQ